MNRTKGMMLGVGLALVAALNCQPSGGGDDDGLGGGGSTGGDGEDGDGSPSGGRTGSGGRSGSGGQSATGGRSGSGGTEMETGGASFGGACVSSGEGGFGGLGGFGGALSTEVFGGEGIYLLCSENSFGLQGMFHLADDSMGAADDGLIHSDLEPDTGGTAESGEEPSAFGDDTVMPCVSGSMARVTGASGEDCISDDCLWAELWGGSIILDLTTSDGGGTDGVWNAAAQGLTGLTFLVTGDVGDAVVRLTAFVPSSDANYCVQIPVGVETSVDFSDLRKNCWDGSDPEPLDSSQIERIQWQVVTNQFSSNEVENFCVESLGVY